MQVRKVPWQCPVLDIEAKAPQSRRRTYPHLSEFVDFEDWRPGFVAIHPGTSRLEELSAILKRYTLLASDPDPLLRIHAHRKNLAEFQCPQWDGVPICRSQCHETLFMADQYRTVRHRLQRMWA